MPGERLAELLAQLVVRRLGLAESHKGWVVLAEQVGREQPRVEPEVVHATQMMGELARSAAGLEWAIGRSGRNPVRCAAQLR